MLLLEIFGSWLLVGVILFGWRRWADGKESRAPHVALPSNGRRPSQGWFASSAGLWERGRDERTGQHRAARLRI